MRVAHIVQRYLPAPLSGSERYVQLISEGLLKRGYEVEVLTSNAYDWDAFIFPFKKKIQRREEVLNNVRVRRFPIRYEIYAVPALMRKVLSKTSARNDLLTLLTSGPFVPDIYFHIKNSNYELVHATPFPFTIVWFSWLASRKAGIPFIVTPLFHLELGQYYNHYLKQILMNCEGVIALTNIERKRLIALGAPPSKVRVIPLGIKVDEYKDADGERFRKKYRLENYHIILYIAPKISEKGGLQVLRAMSLVQKHIPNVALIAIGRRNNQWIRERAKIKNVNIIDLEWINENEKKDAFAACDIFVMPSKADSYGFVYLEAWTMGKPVIGAKVGTMPDVIRDGVDGLLVEFGNEIELAQKIILLLQNRSLREKLGLNGKLRVIEEHSLEKMLNNVDFIYRQVINTCR